jgi:DNA end-binding protein Ku
VADRPIWRGHLRLALVSCPVALYSAHHEASNLHFHFINPATGNRVRTVTQDAETDEELSRRDLSRGYEFEKDQYVILDEDDFEQARIESNATMVVDKFVEREAIDPVYFNTPYYMAPDGEAGQDVYVVLRDAIAQTGRMALSRVVIARRERAVAIMPMDRGLVVHTLYEEREITDPKSLFDTVPKSKPDTEMIKLARMLIDRQTAAFDPADMEDRYETRLRAVIEAKIKGVKPKAVADVSASGSNVVDLMAALKKSLGQESGKAPARKAEVTPIGAKSAATKPAAKKPAAKKVSAATKRTTKKAS